MSKELVVEMTSALEAYMMERRAFYSSQFPNMTRHERVQYLTEDFFREGMRLRGGLAFTGE